MIEITANCPKPTLRPRARFFPAISSANPTPISNTQQVSKIRGITEELGLGVATPAKARAMLALKRR
ncbi:MAG: 3-keto-5-aminohexanoate cleavage protein [Bradyrhizobium sp.]